MKWINPLIKSMEIQWSEMKNIVQNMKVEIKSLKKTQNWGKNWMWKIRILKRNHRSIPHKENTGVRRESQALKTRKKKISMSARENVKSKEI